LRKILIVFGTRPEAIKMAPLINKIKDTSSLSAKVCVTAQHREMLDSVLYLFEIEPDYDLNLMRSKQTITDVTIRVLKGLEDIIEQEKPDLVLVQGDTTTSMAAALAAFYQQITVGHVEAGLRSGNIYSPFPEEMNRRLTGTIAQLHFAPTEGNKRNLLDGGIKEKQIFITGNTVIDALYMVIKKNYRFPIPLLNELDYDKKKVILMTAHRRENWGEGMRNIFLAVRSILENNLDTELVFPVHLNPIVKDLADEVFASLPRAHIISPLDYAPFVNLMSRSFLVLTDSGGIQEEAPALGKPVIVLRNETERPEAVEAGTVKIAGIEQGNINRLTQKLIDDKNEYEKMAKAINPYGDGHAAERIAEHIEEWFA